MSGMLNKFRGQISRSYQSCYFYFSCRQMFLSVYNVVFITTDNHMGDKKLSGKSLKYSHVLKLRELSKDLLLLLRYDTLMVGSKGDEIHNTLC